MSETNLDDAPPVGEVQTVTPTADAAKACPVCGRLREMMADREPCPTCGKQLEDT